jgi:hypothetical protein
MIFDTTWHDVNLWREPFPPSTVLELLLPEEADGGGAVTREVVIGREEVRRRMNIGIDTKNARWKPAN